MKQTRYFYFVMLLVVSVLLWGMPESQATENPYEFERMWPVLEQDWYFSFPDFVAVDGDGNVYVAEGGSHRVKKFTSSGTYITGWGGYGTQAGKFDCPMGVAVDAAGYVYVADWGNHRIQKFTSSGEFTAQWGHEGSRVGELNHPIGLAIDGSGNVYVADTGNHRIQKFSSNGLFLSKWGKYGSGSGEFDNPMGIAIDAAGNVYVSDSVNCRIQKFTSSGGFLAQWGSEGSEDGKFDLPYGLTVDNGGIVYVVDRHNHRIQVFDSSGTFLNQWGGYGAGKGQMDDPCGIAVDSEGKIYVGDADNSRIQKFTTAGAFVAKWDSAGNGDGQFNIPSGVAMDAEGNVYVADYWNHRIQKFSAQGAFVSSWGGYGSGEGRFKNPEGVAVDPGGYVYVSDYGNDRIQKFTLSGEFSAILGKSGSDAGELDGPTGIAVDSEGNVYVAECGNHRIQKFSSAGGFAAQWGSYGSGNGQLKYPFGLAVDRSGNVYVADWGNHRIQKFSSTGAFITQWGRKGAGNGQFNSLTDVAVDDADHVYVADTFNNRIQKFTSDGGYVTTIGSIGSAPGLVNNPVYLCVSSRGKIYVTEGHNNRVQVFAPTSETDIQKAIIVAGSGPYEGNTLWPATQMCANYAFRALNFQGYSAENIYYLSADTTSDTDNDGIPDADADATNVNLENAIKYWAQDADNLFLYLVGHGRDGVFVMGEFENLQASDLDLWLDHAQTYIPDFVAMVYDGCHSGSFVASLIPPTGKPRIIAASAAPNESAIFEADGQLSFGYQFFSQFFGGARFYDAYVNAKKSVEGAYDLKQNPQLEVDGNGTPNDKSDKEQAQTIKIGKERVTASDLPRIEAVSPNQTLTRDQTSASIYARNVNGDGIQEVFAVIKPPDAGSGSADEPVTNLPTIQLTKVQNTTGDLDDYIGYYDQFNQEGAYHIAIFARDQNSLLSLPSETSVIVPSSNDCLPVAGDLSIRVPCAEYNGNKYGFSLDFYHNPDNTGGFHWKLVMSTLSPGESGSCIPIGTDLSMPLDCVSYNGTQYGFTLRRYANPHESNGLYWKMDGSTLVVK